MIIKGESEAHTIPEYDDEYFDRAVETSINIDQNPNSGQVTATRKFKRMVFDRAVLTKRFLDQQKSSVRQ